jgi:TPR repeat protein
LIVLTTVVVSAWLLLREDATPRDVTAEAPQTAAPASDSQPLPAVTPEQPKAAPRADPAAAAQRQQFQAMLSQYLGNTRVTSRELRGLLAQFRIADAIAWAQKESAAGSIDALIVLSEMSEVCAWRNWDGAKRTRTSHDEYQSQVRAGARSLPADLQARIEAALAVDRQWIESWLAACSSAKLDRGAIRQQLRVHAEAGDEASLRQLAALSEREEARRFLLSAAMLGDPQAQVDLAASYYTELKHENRPVDVPRMRYWLEVAAKHSPHAQYMLGECRLEGCDGRPPETEAGVALLRQAARGGDAFALKMLADTLAPGTGSFTNEEQYAWLLFERELLDSGCVSPTSYPLPRIDNWQRLQNVSKGLSPYALSTAQTLGDSYWRAYGAAARGHQGCG